MRRATRSSQANGASELITPGVDGIVLDDAADIGALAAVLRRLAGDRWLRAALGRAARSRAEQLGVDAAFASIAEVYGEVVAARGLRLERIASENARLVA